MQIDTRTIDQIESGLRDTAPFFMPQGLDQVFSTGYGKALARIFSEMAELVVKRLNKAPDNHFLAFLDVLGVKLLPPQPSVAPVIFHLSTGAPAEGVEIPAGISVTAGDLHFETERMIWAIPQQIITGFVYLPSLDRIFTFPNGICNGSPLSAAACLLSAACDQGDQLLFVDDITRIKKGDQIIVDPTSLTAEYATVTDVKDTALQLARKIQSAHAASITIARNVEQSLILGEDLQEHCLYIGHASCFNIVSATTIQLKGTAAYPLGDLSFAQFIWEYWTGDVTTPPCWKQFTSVQSQGNDLVLTKDADDEVKKTKVNGIENRWIRCWCAGGMVSERQFSITIASPSILDQTDFDAAMYNNVAIDLSAAPILPFGTRPRQYDCFYLASKEAFSKPGATISVIFSKSGTDVAKQNPLIVWEYWNGTNWTSLSVLGLRKTGEQYDFNLIDGFDPNNPRTLKFVCPTDFVETEVAGKVNLWIRLRIAAGDYGSEIEWNDTQSQWVPVSSIIVPNLASIKLLWTCDADKPPEVCLAVNNLTTKNLTDQLQQNKPVQPFELLTSSNLPDANGMLFFGFDGQPQNGPVSIYFSLSNDLPISRSLDNPVKWYCSLADGTWKPVDTIDATYNLTRSGTVEFLFPDEFASQLLFGQERYWILACFTNNISSDAPAIDAIYINAVMAMQAETITDEVLGGSTTDPNQTFYLLRSPVIDCQLWVDESNSISEEEKGNLAAQGFAVQDEPGRFGVAGRYWVEWVRVDDFLDSTQDKRHYTLDVTNGEIQFGDGVYGMIPPPGKGNIKATYSVGGGTKGNVAIGAINTLKSSIGFVDRVSNPIAAQAGADAETINDVMLRGPGLVDHRNRVVTLHDFEQLATQASADVKRTKGYVSGKEVHVIVVPDAPGDQPIISLPERERIENYLAERCLNTVLPQDIFVDNPKYVPVDASVTVVPLSMETAVDAKKAVAQKLHAFFHPLTGGANGDGWEFGRAVLISDVYAILGSIGGVDHVTNLQLAPTGEALTTSDVSIDDNALVCPGTYRITVTMEG